jgi:hypothetical protein
MEMASPSSALTLLPGCLLLLQAAPLLVHFELLLLAALPACCYPLVPKTAL